MRRTAHPHRPLALLAALPLALPATAWAQSAEIADLGTLGGAISCAYGVSADGAVVVGDATTAGDAADHAFRWTQAGGMADLGTLGGTNSGAFGVSANGAVVVGSAHTTGDAAEHAFRWTQAGGMADLGTLGGTNSWAAGVSADGMVVVGRADTTSGAGHAFRWTQAGGMADLGTLGGTNSGAFGVSANGAVVVGSAQTTGDAAEHAFRWTQAGGMADLGTLGGTTSWATGAFGVSANGAVVVGSAQTTGDAAWRAFRWTQATGMQSVEDWLRGAGVAVPADITDQALATNGDGSVVVGGLENGKAFIARVAAAGSGLVTLDDVQTSLAGTAAGGNLALTATATVLNGAHSRPLARRAAAGQTIAWLAGDWGRDDHGSRDGDVGLAEVGIGRNFGAAQVNVSLGSTWAKQRQPLDGTAKTDGLYLLAEALVPVSGKLWAVAGGYVQRGAADLRRGYLNAGVPVASLGHPDVETRGLRGRLELDRAYRFAGADFSPYADVSYAETTLAAYTETGGGFPARFDERKEKATELRLGVNADKSLDDGLALFGTFEAAHRFERAGARTSGELLGLFGFDIPGRENQRDWLRAGAGVEGRLADGRASISLNLTNRGETPSYWLAVGWRKVF